MSTGIQEGLPEKRRRSQAIKAPPREVQTGISSPATGAQLGHGHGPIDVRRFRLRPWQCWTLGSGILLLAVLTLVFWSWWMAPARRVPRLLRELRDLPIGKFGFSFSRHGKTIHAELDALGLEAVPALIDALDARTGIASDAAQQLAKLGDLRAVEPLIRYLRKNPDHLVGQRHFLE